MAGCITRYQHVGFRMTRHIGVTVLPEYIQSEGAVNLLDQLQIHLGATAVTTSPYLATVVPEGQGHREPPSDAGIGNVRLLSRPLWGKRELWMTITPSFVPNREYYGAGPYQPDPATTLTKTEGPILTQFLDDAKARGLSVSLQVMAAIPPCYRVQFGGPIPEDEPLMPKGQPVLNRVDNNACLASENLRAYMRGMIADLCRNYAQVDYLRFDWPEYPPYHFQSLLTDYNPQVAKFASQIDVNFEKLSTALQDAPLEVALAGAFIEEAPFSDALQLVKEKNPALNDHFRLRDYLVLQYGTFLVETVSEFSDGKIGVILQGFPPPLSDLSGFIGLMKSGLEAVFAVKFYTMHWSLIGANYARHVSKILNRPIDDVEQRLARNLLGLTSAAAFPMAYPTPVENHGVSEDVIQKMVEQLGIANAVGISHAYGPVDDVVARFAALFKATRGQIEINRYAYLSDEIISEIGAFLREQPCPVIAENVP